MGEYQTTISQYIRVLPLGVAAFGALSAVSIAPEEATRIAEARSQRPDRLLKSPGALPFRAADVVHYFVGALETPAKSTKEGHTVFENAPEASPEDRYRILIVQENGEVVVSFAVSGDYGMNLAREFFECPLFRSDESEQLYALLNEAASAPIFKLDRFNVSARLWETGDRVHLVLRFFHPHSSVRL